MPITKQSIAIIGIHSEIAPAIAKAICTANYRLLLFGENESQIKALAGDIRSIASRADVEILNCSHMACWEADMIILSAGDDELGEIIGKIKDVATQKIVLRISGRPGLNGLEDLETRLPHSKTAEIMADHPAGTVDQQSRRQVKVRARDSGALNMAMELVTAAGYGPVPVS